MKRLFLAVAVVVALSAVSIYAVTRTNQTTYVKWTNADGRIGNVAFVGMKEVRKISVLSGTNSVPFTVIVKTNVSTYASH